MRTDIRTGYPKTWRNVAGYNLNRLLADRQQGKALNLASLVVGSEGTLAAICRLKVNLVERPRSLHLMILHFDELQSSPCTGAPDFEITSPVPWS
jgi:FAD/FMN-containing dehydrogenase